MSTTEPSARTPLSRAEFDVKVAEWEERHRMWVIQMQSVLDSHERMIMQLGESSVIGVRVIRNRLDIIEHEVFGNYRGDAPKGGNQA